MNNIWLIIKREYLSRVMKKSFLIMTFLAPLVFVGVFVLIGYLSSRGGESKTIEILDESELFIDTFKSDSTSDEIYRHVNISLDSAKNRVSAKVVDGLVYIPKMDNLDSAAGVTIYAPGNPSIKLTTFVERRIERKIEDIKLERSGLNQDVIASLEADISISTINLTGSGEEKQSSSKAATIVGYISAFMIYMFVFIYGAQCMRGVIEEKTSRIVEVILSSTKSFHLMMGKVIGIASVGLTQFAMWIILSMLLGTIGLSVAGFSSMQEMKQAQATSGSDMVEVLAALESINTTMTVFAFIFFFLGGYLLYGALFAAVGSAVDSDADAQQFMFPITLPLIASIASLGVVLVEPNGSFAFWMSMVPITSPVVMMMRVPFGVPVWELLLSMSLLVGGFIFTIWLASRIYRVGILMHGTKVNYKTLAKWFFQKN
ncbi:MAG: ABC transporter permease [Cytophagales bacterium]|nr:ABC transporter permease [Cytophagales bacterium]